MTNTQAHDPVGETLYQEVKINTGAAGVAGDIVSATNPLPVSSGGTTSSSDNTSAAVPAGGNYTGIFEQNDSPDVGVSLQTDVAGILYFDFSPDATNVNTFPVAGFNVASGIHEFHTAVKLGRYFRARFVSSAGAPTYFRLYSYYGNFRQGNAPISFDIADDADATVVKAVISGVGDTTARVTDHKALQVVPPPEGKGGFGEVLVANMEHETIANFTYGIHPLQMTTLANQSGSASAANAMATVSTGAAANSSCMLHTSDRVRYQPGHGSRARFTALFTTGVADSSQGAGIGDESDGFFFGYDGTAFGVLHRKNGSQEIRTLTVSTGSSHAENITITLDGDAKADVAVTSTADVTLTANEIAAADYSDVGRGWTARAVGDEVRFVSWSAEVQTGTYSLSSATSAVGTFAQDVAGVVPTEAWTAQASWNGDDIFDGNGLTGTTLDPTKGNVYQITYQWLGFGLISFYIEDPSDGEYHLVHKISYANANTTPSISNPTLPICIYSVNVANTTDLSVSSASMGGFTDGKSELIGPRGGYDASITLGATAAETPFFTIRCKEIFQSKINTAILKVLLIQAAVDHSKPVEVAFYANAVLTGAAFVSAGASSVVETDTTATAFSGGTFLFSMALGQKGNELLKLSDDQHAAVLLPGTTFTVTIKPKSGNAAEATVVFNTVELY